jgi:hypothetical protein
LRVPSSYLPTGPDDGTATYHDGKVGVAYIQEFRFAKFVERLQRQIQDDLDREFKKYLKWSGLELDDGNFSIELPKPMNFSSYREIQLDSERANLLGQVDGIPYLSNQFKLKKYLGLTEEEMAENERLWIEENGTPDQAQAIQQGDPMTGGGGMGLGDMGIRPEPDDALDLEGEPDLGELEDAGGDDPAAAAAPDSGLAQ